MDYCVELRSSLDDLLKRTVAFLPQIKRQLSEEHPSDYIGHIHVESNSQKEKLGKQTHLINQCVPDKSNLDILR